MAMLSEAVNAAEIVSPPGRAIVDRPSRPYRDRFPFTLARTPMTAANLAEAETALRHWSLRFPDAMEDFPWGERVIKVRGKIFVFLGMVGSDLRVGVKLPLSAEMALTLPFVEPSGYGLARAGWVTARFGPRRKPPLDLLHGWIDQSYRAVAPKKLVKLLDTGASDKQ
jgi:predicted DNA-binding protein (MmcQ/YjbR family)